MHASKYVFKDEDLYWKNMDGLLLLCLDELQGNRMLKEMHEGVYGGHFSVNTTTHKILMARYYWPRVFNDSFKYVEKCEACQKYLEK